MNNTTRLLAICLSVYASVASAETPAARESFIRRAQSYLGVHLEYWRYTGQNTFETVIPIYYSMGLGQLLEGLAVDVVTSPTVAVHGGGSAASTTPLFSVSNTKVRASYLFKNLVLVTMGAQIPTGGNKLSPEQMNTAGKISTRQMSFKVKRTGSGFNFDATAATSYEIAEDFVLGAAIGYLAKGAYTPLEGGTKFNPGNELTLTVGADYGTVIGNLKAKLIGELGWTHYGKDRQHETTVYQAGSSFALNLRAQTQTTDGLKNVVALSVDLNTKDKDLSANTTSRSSNVFTLSDNIYLRRTNALRPYLLGRTSLYTPNVLGSGSSEVKAGRALTGGLGAGGVLDVKRTVRIRGQVIVEAGGMDGNGLLGGELSGGIRYVF